MVSLVKRGVRKIVATITLVSVEVILVMTAFFAALTAFVLIARMIFYKKKDAIDNEAFNFLSKHVSNINTDVMQFFTFLGTHYFLIAANIVLICYYLFVNKHRWYTIKVPVISISTVLLMFVLKHLFNRPRPLIPLLKEAKGYSFPSGHALNSSIFYGLLIYIVYQSVQNKFLKWALIACLLLLILFIGISRIYLRVHYASDVLAGFALGVVWLVISLTVLNKIQRISEKEADLIVP